MLFVFEKLLQKWEDNIYQKKPDAKLCKVFSDYIGWFPILNAVFSKKKKKKVYQIISSYAQSKKEWRNKVIISIIRALKTFS